MGEAIGPDQGRDHMRRQETVVRVKQRALSTGRSQRSNVEYAQAAERHGEALGVKLSTDWEAAFRSSLPASENDD